MYVCDALFDDVVLRHLAFRDEWFKINVMLDERGRAIETPAGMEEAAVSGLLSENEHANARRGLDRPLGIIGSGELVSFLDDVVRFRPSGAGPALPMVPRRLAEVPELQPGNRPTWSSENNP